MINCPCGCKQMNGHICNAYCNKPIHADLCYSEVQFNNMDEGIESLQNAYIKEWYCKIASYHIVIGMRPALEAPIASERFPEQREYLSKKYFAYLFTFQYGGELKN